MQNLLRHTGQPPLAKNRLAQISPLPRVSHTKISLILQEVYGPYSFIFQAISILCKVIHVHSFKNKNTVEAQGSSFQLQAF